MNEAEDLYEHVIKNNYCIGCGACASVKNSPFEMHLNDFGNMTAHPIKKLSDSNVKVLKICPFSNQSMNEDELGNTFFSEIENKDTKIGKYFDCFAGYVEDKEFREKGSSGGFGKWLGYILLKEEKIDYFIQVLANQNNNPKQPLFNYAIFSNEDDVINGSKSAYYPVTLDRIIKIIREIDGRYAITGVPCFIKTIRLLSIEDEIFKNRIKYTIGIICGGMKSANQSKMIGWQLGVKPENLVGIDFRRKPKDGPPSNKIYQVWSNSDSIERYKEASKIFGTDWFGFFHSKACDYCDDVVGETSDISIGDAWLPQFANDPNGTSVLVIRNLDILEIVNRYKQNNKLKIQTLQAEDVAKSQEGGFRHKREALSFRISKKELSNNWYPQKRIKANQYEISKRRKQIYSLREQIARQSHTSFLKALNNNQLSIFQDEMIPLVKRYNKLIYESLSFRIIRKLKKILNVYFAKLYLKNF